MSPRRQQDYNRIRDGRRQQILQAALQVFARCGLSAARMADIAREAAVSAGLAYHYFSSKEEMFHELVTIALHSSLEVYENAAISEGSAWERLSRLVHRVVPSAFSGIGSLYFLVVIQSFTFKDIPEETRRLVTEKSPRYHEILVDLITQAQAEGSVRPGNTVAFANGVNAVIQGLAVMSAADPGMQMPDPETILHMVQA